MLGSGQDPKFLAALITAALVAVILTTAALKYVMPLKGLDSHAGHEPSPSASSIPALAHLH